MFDLIILYTQYSIQFAANLVFAYLPAEKITAGN